MPRNVRGTPISVNTFWKHYYGVRNISARAALLYEEVLGIPRSELRPDLWPPEQWRAIVQEEGVNAPEA